MADKKLGPTGHYPNGFSAEHYKAKWIVTVPAGGHFKIYYYEDINAWQRFWLRFIGWIVSRAN